MKDKGNIAIFVPHAGCPQRCSFCDQRKISAAAALPTVAEVQERCRMALSRPDRPAHLELAFFGGSFTAIPVSEQNRLLEAVQPFVTAGQLDGIRISTRPDAITPDILERLQTYHVTAIELGTQSMDDAVLEKNHRGHTAQAVRTAAAEIRHYGFSLGLQMMVGLDGSTLAKEYRTLEEILALHPDTLRIYPLVVLRGTELAERFERGEFSLYSMEEVTAFCADALCACAVAGVKVIRCGLHAEELLSSEAVAGFYHPAFREEVESLLCLRQMLRYAERHPQETVLSIRTAPSWVSRIVGHKKKNKSILAERGIGCRLILSPECKAGEIQIGEEVCNVFQIAGNSGLQVVSRPGEAPV